MLKQALVQAFYPQAVPSNYFKIASSLWLGKKQLKAYIEDEWALNDSLRRMSQRYSDIKIPVVIVTGDKDKIVSPKGKCISTSNRDSRIATDRTQKDRPRNSPDAS
jgi:alpha-beta hydrolase superfamily lysophospholipase